MPLALFGAAAAVLAMTAECTLRIDHLRPRRPVNVGSAQILIADNVNVDLYEKLFPDTVPPTPLTMTLRTNRADGRRTMANVHQTLTECDRKLADGVRAYLVTVLRRYNRTAFQYLTAVAGEPESSTAVVGLVGDGYRYPFFAYLNDTGFDVRSTYDNVLLYTSSYVRDGLTGAEELLRWIEPYGTTYVEDDARLTDVENPKNANAVKLQLARLETELRQLSWVFRKSYPQWLFVYDPEELPEPLSPELLDFWESVNKTNCTLLVNNGHVHHRVR